jgi:hypothetical protein
LAVFKNVLNRIPDEMAADRSELFCIRHPGEVMGRQEITTRALSLF